MKKIFVCSAFSGKDKEAVKKNVELTIKYCEKITQEGNAPFAPHLIYPQWLNDKTKERDIGIACGLAFLRVCNALHFFTIGGVISPGMREEITHAHFFGILVYRREVIVGSGGTDVQVLDKYRDVVKR